MPIEDKAARLAVLREVARYDMNTSLLTVRVINHVAYFDGRVSRNHGPNSVRDLRRALSEIEDTVKAMPEIGDVVMEVAVD